MKKTLLLVTAIAAIVLSYGYWHSHTHASTYIVLTFESSGKNNVKSDYLSRAEVLFMDADGTVLAEGIRDKNYNYIHLVHPKIGDCHEIETNISSKKSRVLWQECFESQSVWIPNWISSVHQVKINHNNCFSRNIPVSILEHNSE